jgi:hypothetical protein
MLDISKPLTAGKATTYFKQEYANADNSYYTQGRTLQGRWHGTFAEELGLTGAVTEEHFARLAQGQDPHTGEQWIEHRQSASTKPARNLSTERVTI